MGLPIDPPHGNIDESTVVMLMILRTHKAEDILQVGGRITTIYITVGEKAIPAVIDTSAAINVVSKLFGFVCQSSRCQN